MKMYDCRFVLLHCGHIVGLSHFFFLQLNITTPAPFVEQVTALRGTKWFAVHGGLVRVSRIDFQNIIFSFKLNVYVFAGYSALDKDFSRITTGVSFCGNSACLISGVLPSLTDYSGLHFWTWHMPLGAIRFTENVSKYCSYPGNFL